MFPFLMVYVTQPKLNVDVRDKPLTSFEETLLPPIKVEEPNFETYGDL